MEHATTNQFGGYIRHLREQRQLSMRGLAKVAGVDSGALTRLESGKTTPTPGTIKALAIALDVPLADLFVRAGYTTPHDLPSMDAYLHTRYGHLPSDVLDSMNDYCQRLISEHGFEPGGPSDHEDEITKPSHT
ncbi:MAG TPA: helix-turn-helix transcriptional regulator [Pseudonocardiaceae bacterium]|jgi:transcriptional regulator with XRE-family HTH domain|nr:helix-turn-helix transcriptional regulator [Pseudonocardiaceae bacterium]